MTSSENDLQFSLELPLFGGGFREVAEYRMSRPGDFESHQAAALVSCLVLPFSVPQSSSTRVAGEVVRLALDGKMPVSLIGSVLRTAREGKGRAS